MANKPIVAWKAGVPSKIQQLFLIYLVHQQGSTELTELSNLLQSRVLGEAAQRSCYDLLNSAESNGWMEKEIAIPTQPSFARSTRAGIEYAITAAPQYLTVVEYSLQVLDNWMLELYHDNEVREDNENGPGDLFEAGGLHALHRTLILHTLAHRQQVIDPLSGEIRPMYMNEIMRDLENFGWIGSRHTFVNVKEEQVKDKHILSSLHNIDVRWTYPTMPEAGKKKTSVEFIIITDSGRKRLEDDLRSTRAMLVKTRRILESWKAILEEITDKEL